MLVADDGSSDGTAELVRQLARDESRVSLLSLDHQGKGWAMRSGMLHVRSEYRFICNADLLFLLQRIPDFAFDVEVLFLAQLMKRPLVEVPIDW